MNSPKKLQATCLPVRQASYKLPRGFTLLEVMIVIGIVSALGVIGFISFSGVMSSKTLENMTNRIAADITYTMERAKTQEDGLQWWMNFNTGSTPNYYLICSGATYAGAGSNTDCGTGGTQIQKVPIPTGLTVYYSGDVIFQKATGLPLDCSSTCSSTNLGAQITTPTDITLTSSNTNLSSKVVTVNTSGRIDSGTTVATAPTVTTGTAEVGYTTATLIGSGTPNNGVTTGWFRYRSTSSADCADDDTWGTRVPSSGGTSLGSGTGPMSYSQNLTDLLSATPYYFCAIAENSVATVLGTVEGFTTLTITAPTVASPTVADITGTSATLGATVTSDGGATLTARGTCWGTSPAPTSNCAAADGTGVSAFTHSRTDLPSSTLIYYRGYATNSAGTGYSADGTFTTTYSEGRYWVNGSGNWSDTAHWATSPGGSSGASAPTSSDDVYFQANSFSGGTGTVTVDAAATAKSINWTGVTNTPTFAGVSTLNIAGSLTLVSGMTRTYTGEITFSATSTGQTIALGGKTLASKVTFNGAGGGWTIQDTFNIGTNALILNAGSLDTNGATVTIGSFQATNLPIAAKTLTLGNSQVNVSGTSGSYPCAWQMTLTACSNGGSANITLNAGGSTINFTTTGSTTASFGGKTYNNVNFTTSTSAGQNFTMYDSSTFNTFVISGPGTTYIANNNTFTNFSRIGSATRSAGLKMNGTMTINGTLTLQGNNGTAGASYNRLFFYANGTGSPRTINVGGSVVLSNVDFREITATGAGWSSATSSFVGDVVSVGTSTNTGISSLVTPAETRWWVGNAGNWSGIGGSHWSSVGSGGASGAKPPLPQDTIVFDGNSISSSNQTITLDMPRSGRNIDFTNVTNNPILLFNTDTFLFDSFTLKGSMIMTVSGSRITLYTKGTANYTNAGVQWKNPILIDAVYSTNGTILMNDDFDSTNSVTVNQGILDANNHKMGMLSFSPNYGWTTRKILMGNNTWTLKGTGTVWNNIITAGQAGGNLIITPGTSTIIISDTTSATKTFAGNVFNSAPTRSGGTYYDLQFTGNGTLTFPPSDAIGTTVANNFHTLTFAPGIGATAQTVSFPVSQTQALSGTLSVTGVSGKTVTFQSSSGTATLNATTTPSTLTYLTVTSVNATGGTPFNCSVGGTCTNTGGTSTGWGF